MIQVHFQIALKYKQRTDGFVQKNFPKILESEIPLIPTVIKIYEDQIQRLFEITQGESAPEYINCMTRYNYCKVHLLDQTESGLHYLQGTLDPKRL